MRSPLRWAGGKGRLAAAITHCVGPHDAYVETCCGGAAVFWAKDRALSAAEILNDTDGELINFYYQLHKNGRRLTREVDAMPYSRGLFVRMLKHKPRGAFQRAVSFWYLNRVAFGGRRSGRTYGVQKSQRAAVVPASILANLDALVDRLRGVIFESVDVTRLLGLYDGAKTLFYVDPPFLGLSQPYACQFGDEDHQRLADALHRVKGTWLLSYNDCREVRAMYRGCRTRRLSTVYTIGRNSSCGGPRAPARELLISNRPLPRK